jgi:hypothetical protein
MPEKAAGDGGEASKALRVGVYDDIARLKSMDWGLL